MSGTLHAIQNAATTIIEVDPLHFRVRKVRSSDVARVGFAALTMIGPGDALEVDTEDPEKVQAAFEAKIARMSPKQMGEITEMQSAVVCAGVLAVSADEGASWDTVQLVMEQKKENPSKGVLCVHSLPPGCVEACFAEIMNLSTDKGAAAERLKSFLGAAGDPPADSRTGEDLRKTATRNTRSRSV